MGVRFMNPPNPIKEEAHLKEKYNILQSCSTDISPETISTILENSISKHLDDSSSTLDQTESSLFSSLACSLSDQLSTPSLSSSPDASSRFSPIHPSNQSKNPTLRPSSFASQDALSFCSLFFGSQKSNSLAISRPTSAQTA